MKDLTFHPPDLDTFKMLSLAFEVGRKGGMSPAVFNAANEAAVQLFLDKKIGFLDIYQCVYDAVERSEDIENPSLSDIIQLDASVKQSMVYEFS